MHRQTLEREARLSADALDGLPTLETGVVVVAPGDGNRRLFDEPPGDARDRGRADDEPVHRGDRGRRRCNARDRGDRAAEQRERDPQRRAGGRPREQADAGRADPVRAGGARGDDRLRPRARSGRQRACDGERAGRCRHRRGDDRLARRHPRRHRSARRAPGSGSPTARPLRCGAELRRCRRCRGRAPPRRRPGDADAAHRSGRAGARDARRRDRCAPSRLSRSRSTPAVSRTIRCSSRRE